MTPEEACWKCRRQGSRNPELESIILQDPKWSYWYALDVVRGRWIKGEPIILQDPKWSYCYALGVIGGRWVEAEGVILGSEWESIYCDRFRIEPCELVPKPDYTL